MISNNEPITSTYIYIILSFVALEAAGLRFLSLGLRGDNWILLAHRP